MAAITYPGSVMAAVTDPPGLVIVGIGYCVTGRAFSEVSNIIR